MAQNLPAWAREVAQEPVEQAPLPSWAQPVVDEQPEPPPPRSYSDMGFSELKQLGEYGRAVGDYELSGLVDEQIEQVWGSHSLPETSGQKVSRIGGETIAAGFGFLKSIGEAFQHPDEDAGLGRKSLYFFTTPGREFAATNINVLKGWGSTLSMGASGTLERTEQMVLDSEYQRVLNESHEQMYGLERPEEFARKLNESLRSANVPVNERQRIIEERTEQYIEQNAEVFKDAGYDPTAATPPPNFAFERIAQRELSEYSELGLVGQGLKFTQDHFRSWAEYQLPEDHWAWRDNVIQRDFAQGMGSFMAFATPYAFGPTGRVGAAVMAGGLGAYDFQQDAEASFREMNDGADLEDWQRDIIARTAPNTGVVMGTAQLAPIAVMYARLREPMRKVTGSNKLWTEVTEAAFIGVQEATLEGFYEWAKNESAQQFEYDPERSNWENVAHAATLGGSVGFVSTLLMRGMLGGRGPQAAARRAYENEVVANNDEVTAAKARESRLFEAYENAEGLADKAKAYSAFRAAQRERASLESGVRSEARKKLDDEFVTPVNDGTLSEEASPEGDGSQDIMLDDVLGAQGVEVDLVAGESTQPTPDFTTATFSPIQEAQQAQPVPAAEAEQDTFRPVMNDQADASTDTVFAETRRVEMDGRPASFGFVFPGNLKVDAETYQFKRTDDPEGRTDRFTGEEAWSPTSSGTIIVHRREDGDYVADGHQRSALARRRKEAGDDPASLYSQALILNESDGWTARDVRLLAALKNVRGETGTAIDAATLIREGGEAVLEALGDTINPKRAIWRDALGLANLSDTVFQQVANGDIAVDRAAIIGRSIQDPGKQLAALEYMRDNPPANQYEAEMIARDINRMQAMESTQGGFDFGDAIAQVPIKERAKILDAARKDLNTRKRVFKQLVKDQALIEGEASNVLDAEGNVQIAQNAETVMEVLNRLVDTNPEINEVLNNAATELAAGNITATAAARELVDRATEVAQSVLSGRETRPGDQQATPAEQPRQRPEPPVSEPVRPEAGESTQESLTPDGSQTRTETTQTAEPAPQAPIEARPVAQEQTDGTADTTARPERPAGATRPEPESRDSEATGGVGDGSPRPAGARPPLRVASEERIPRPGVHVNADSYQAGLDSHQQLAVNLAIDRFESGGLGFMLADGTGTGKTRQILAIADQYQKRSGKKVLIVTQNQQIIKGSFTADAQTMGLKLSDFETATYDSVRSGKDGQGDYGLVIFDEAHNLKNTTAAKTIAANNVRAEHKLFATATPMDSIGGAVYFMSEVTGLTESALYDQIGLTVIEQYNETTGKTETHVQLSEGFKWDDVKRNLIGLRNEAVEQGAMLRREYPFYGEMTAETVRLTESQTQSESRIDDYWQAEIEAAKNPMAKRNRAGQRLGELSRWLESEKVDAAYDMIKRKLAEGRSIIIVAEGVNRTTIKALNREVQGALGALAARLEADGIPFAQIYGTGDKAGAVERFQSGQVQVALATPKSGGTGINLDDVVGNRPRTLVTLTDNYAGDTFEQILGRVSRRNTASPAEVISLTSDAMSDTRRRQILTRKMEALRAIQTGEDLDAAHLEDGPSDVRLSVAGNTPDGQRIGREEAQQALESMVEGLAVKPESVEAVQSEADLPDGIKIQIMAKNAQGRTRGVITNGKIYLVMDNIGSRAEMERVLWHELKGHYGLRQLLGDDLNPVLDKVWNAYGRKGLAPWIDAYYGKRFDPTNPDHRREVAEEKLASLAETDPQNRWVKRAIGAVRDWLRRHGFMTLANLTESDLIYLMAKTGDFVDGTVKASDAHALPAWARSDTVTGNRPTWGEFLTHISGWRVQQIRDMLKEVNPELDVQSMDRAKLESTVRGFTGYAGVSDALIPLSAYEALEGHQIRFSQLNQPDLLDDAPSKQQQDAEKKRREVDDKLRGKRDVPVEDGPGDLFGPSTDRQQQTLFSIAPEDSSIPVPKQNLLNRAVVGALQVGRAPAAVFDAANMTLDTAIRTPFALIGGLDRGGRWKPGVAIYDGVSNVITDWKPKGDSAPIRFVGYTMDYLRAGFVDRWGQTDAQRGISRQAGRDRDAILSFMGRILSNLNQQGLKASDYVTLTNILEGKPVSDKRLNELAEPIRNTIDDLGMELVRLGFLDAETWQKGVGKYLHRSYKKYEAELQGIQGIPFIGDKIVRRAFNKRIKGDEFRARGLKENVTQGRLQRNLPPDWWKRKIKPGEADKSLKGTRWIVLDHIEAAAEGSDPLISEDAQAPTRIRRDRVYWPADEPVPSMYAGWENQGEFEVLSIRGDKITLRRDYTDAEMEAMGRVMDARFNIIRTFQLMAHDISTGRFFEDIAKSELSIKANDRGRDEIVVQGRKATHTSLITADWVEVPRDTIYPGAKVAQYGALAGRLVRPEVWREIVSMEKAGNANTWMKLLRHWKANKTIRNPVVHMNNVMSNIVLMDLQDVSMSSLVNAMIEFTQGGPMHQEAAQAGAYGGIFVNNELNRRVLKPIMDEIIRDMKTHGEQSPQATARVWSEIKLKIAQSAKALKGLDQLAFKAYEMEDVIFRLATYAKYRKLGFSQAEAADIAVDAFLNYDIQAPAINALRNYALPFLAYSYRAGPVIAAALAHRPWKMAKFILLGYLWNQFAYWYDDDGDEDLERASLREQTRGMTWMSVPGTDLGVHRMIKMPFRDQYDQPLYLDAMRWIPFGDVFDTNQTISGLPAWMQVSGPLVSGMELLMNKSMFTGQDIYDEDIASVEGGALANLAAGNVTEKMSSMLDFAWKSYAPGAAFVPGSWHYEKISSAARGGTDQLGRNYSVPTAISSAMGVKLQPVDTDLATMYQGRELQRFQNAIRAHARDAQSRRQRNLISEAEYEREIREYERRMEMLQRRVEEFQEPRQ